MKIESVSFIEDSAISFVVKPVWQTEDSEQLYSLIVSNHLETKIIEETHGADRYTYRFRFFDKDFLLHTESYSQSCWIESPNNEMEEMIILWRGFTEL